MNRGSGIQTTNVTVDQLGALPTLQPYSDEMIADLHKSVRAFVINAGVEIAGEKDETTELFLTIEGTCRVNSFAAAGRELTYQILQPGEFFGEVAAIDAAPRSASVSANSNAVVGVISQADMNNLLQRHPEFVNLLLMRLARLARWLTERVYEYHNYAVKGRICAELLRAIGDTEQQLTEIHITDHDMATRVGTNRANVTRIYGALKKEGLIERNPQRIRVVRPDALRALVASNEFT